MQNRPSKPALARALRAGARVTLQGKTPKPPRDAGNDNRGDNQMSHEPRWLIQRFDEQPRRDIGDDDHGNYPAEDETKNFGEDDVGIARDVEKIEIAVNE